MISFCSWLHAVTLSNFSRRHRRPAGIAVPCLVLSLIVCGTLAHAATPPPAVSLIYTIAGNEITGYSGDGGPATVASIALPWATALDANGNLYIADTYNNLIRRVAANTGVISTIAGTLRPGYSGDNGPAIKAALNNPEGICLDAAGNIFFVDSRNNVIRKITAATGTIATVAGNGTAGFSGDNGPALSAQLYFPEFVAVDSAGNLYIADTLSNRIREVTAENGTITTVAGNDQGGYNGDGQLATAANLRGPQGIAVDSAGNLYIADSGNNLIRRVDAKTRMISTVAGTAPPPPYLPKSGYSGDNGPATSALLDNPVGVTPDSAGNLYIADAANLAIRKVTASSGIITTVEVEGGVQTSSGVALDIAGNLYIAEMYGNRIRKVTAPAAPPTAVTDAPAFSVAAGTYNSPQTLTISDATPGAYIYVTTDGTQPTTAGQGYYGPIDISGAVTVRAIAVAPGYLASATTSAAYVITSPPVRIIQTVAGNGELAYGGSGDGGPATAASLYFPTRVTFDAAGDLFISDGIALVREVSTKTGIISTVAGTFPPAFDGPTYGDGGPATSATLTAAGIAVDAAGNLYIADTALNAVRIVSAKTGIINRYAGTYPSENPPDSIGDGGPATDAQLSNPTDVVLDSSGNLYIADYYDSRVRVVSAATGIITTYAGNGEYGSTGDGGPAADASLAEPSVLALDAAGNLYIATYGSGQVRRVDKKTGIITTVAGIGNPVTTSGDGGPAIDAEVAPVGLAVDNLGNLFISGGEVREVSASTGIISRIAGNGYYGFSGDGGSATVAQLDYPQGLAFDASGNLYFADQANFRIRKLSPPTPTPTPTFAPASGIYTTFQTVTISDATAGAVIYYTTDGTAPTTSSTMYSDPITVSATGTLQAIAIADGHTQSPAATGSYTIDLAASTVTITPAVGNITYTQTLSVAVTVAGATGQARPTGTLTLSSGAYSAQQTLAGGASNFVVPAGAFSASSNTLTASYSGDAAYTPATSATTITVSQILIAVPAPAAVSPGASAKATATVSAGSGYAGTLNLTCALTTSPAGAQSLPACSLSPASVAVAASGTGSSALSVTTTAASTSSALLHPASSNSWKGWSEGGALAFALLIGIPTRRRRIAALAVLCIVGAGAIGCGSGSSSKPPPTVTTPATTAGNYTFTVTGTHSANAKITSSATVVITVQ